MSVKVQRGENPQKSDSNPRSINHFALTLPYPLCHFRRDFAIVQQHRILNAVRCMKGLVQMTRPNWSVLTVSLSQRNAIRGPISHTISGVILIVLKGSVIHIIPIASMTIHYSDGGNLCCLDNALRFHCLLMGRISPAADKVFQLDPRELPCIMRRWCCAAQRHVTSVRRRHAFFDSCCYTLMPPTYPRGREWPVCEKKKN